jgi:integral membrane protein (TIGR00529 family)
MLDIFKIAIVFTAILIFLRLKWNIGYVLLLASGLLAILYLIPIPTILSTIKSTVTDTVTIKLFFALTLIKSLELILRERQVLAKMMEASRNLLKRKKAVIISMPMLIGLLPSLGGAYFSAPMVDESTKGLKMSPEEKGFINYWFRHPWEYILPLYPGILLASAITKIELRSLILANLTYAALILITGFLFSMRGVEGKFIKSSEFRVQSPEKKTKDLWSFLPVTVILIMVMVMHVELHYALGFTILMLFVFYRFSPKEAFRAIRHGFTPDVIVIVFGTMLFKFTMENSGAVAHLSQYFRDMGIPILPILFILPFISGLLTGITVGFVGGTFPLLLSLAGGAHLNQITFAFASGFVGVLLSPVHLCLVLTREYFKADMWGIYKKTIPGCAIIMAGSLVVYFIL